METILGAIITAGATIIAAWLPFYLSKRRKRKPNAVRSSQAATIQVSMTEDESITSKQKKPKKHMLSRLYYKLTNSDIINEYKFGRNSIEVGVRGVFTIRLVNGGTWIFDTREIIFFNAILYDLRRDRGRKCRAIQRTDQSNMITVESKGSKIQLSEGTIRTGYFLKNEIDALQSTIFNLNPPISELSFGGNLITVLRGGFFAIRLVNGETMVFDSAEIDHLDSALTIVKNKKGQKRAKIKRTNNPHILVFEDKGSYNISLTEATEPRGYFHHSEIDKLRGAIDILQSDLAVLELGAEHTPTTS